MAKDERYSYTSDGVLEAVMFVMKKDGKILAEKRVENDPPTWFIPNGKIEKKDKDQSGDYKEVALKREVSEELGPVVLKEFELVSEYLVEAINAVFYIYMVHDWEGEVATENYEEGQLSAELHWLSPEEARQFFTYPVVHHALDLLSENK